MNDEELAALALDILADYLQEDIEFSVVYEDERAEDLTEDEQRKVHDFMSSAKITATISTDESDWEIDI
jgi:hypothetical protein